MADKQLDATMASMSSSRCSIQRRIVPTGVRAPMLSVRYQSASAATGSSSTRTSSPAASLPHGPTSAVTMAPCNWNRVVHGGSVHRRASEQNARPLERLARRGIAVAASPAFPHSNPGPSPRSPRAAETRPVPLIADGVRRSAIRRLAARRGGVGSFDFAAKRRHQPECISRARHVRATS